jgi:AraC-like DNA-binding protein
MLKTIAHGLEHLPSGHSLARHRHYLAYAIVILRGAFEQAGYAGRVRVRAGDLLVQPPLDAHTNAMRIGPGATILRLAWPAHAGGVWRLPDVDAIARTAEGDLADATLLAREQWLRAVPAAIADDLPDQLAAALVAGEVPSLARWATERGVARETVARAFTRSFGVTACRFRLELKTREACLQLARSNVELAAIAAATGFADQAHMTRSVGQLTGMSPRVWRQREARRV